MTKIFTMNRAVDFIEIEKERFVELIICRGYDSGTWDTAFVSVPAQLPEEKAGEVAVRKMRPLLDDEEDIVYIGVYCVYDDEQMADFEEL